MLAVSLPRILDTENLHADLLHKLKLEKMMIQKVWYDLAV